MNTKIRVKTQKVNDKISDKTKHIMKISHINLNIYDKTAFVFYRCIPVDIVSKLLPRRVN